MVHIYAPTIKEALNRYHKQPDYIEPQVNLLEKLKLANIPNIILDAAMDGYAGILVYTQSVFKDLTQSEKDELYAEARQQLKDVDLLDTYMVPEDTSDLRIVGNPSIIPCKLVYMEEASIPNPHVQRGVIIPF